MTDDSSTPLDAPDAEGGAATDGGTDAVDDRPERPPGGGLVETLGVVDHAKRGLAVGVALAVAVFAFFVVLPLVDPSTPARAESPVLYVALAFVVATSGTLLVASALAVRAVAGRVMAYEKWVRRGALVATVGGLWWALTGALAVGVASDTLPASAEPLVVATLPLPVLLLALGAWSALARTGARTTDADAIDAPDVEAARTDADAIDAPDVEAARTEDAAEAPSTDDAATGPVGGAFDHVLARPRLANASAVLVLAAVAVVHVATFLQTDAFLGTAPTTTTGATVLVVGGLALATGTGVLAALVRRTTTATALPGIASALAGAAIALTVLAPTTPLLTPLALLALPGLAWLALGTAITRDTGTYPERPI